MEKALKTAVWVESVRLVGSSGRIKNRIPCPNIYFLSTLLLPTGCKPGSRGDEVRETAPLEEICPGLIASVHHRGFAQSAVSSSCP